MPRCHSYYRDLPVDTCRLHVDPSIQGLVLQELDKKLPKCPVEVGTFPHWLIINGKQPAIPENAVVDRRQPPAKRRKVASQQKTGKAFCLTMTMQIAVPSACRPLSTCAVQYFDRHPCSSAPCAF